MELLLLCGSKKPAPHSDRKSATREVLKVARDGIVDMGLADQVAFLDVREMDLPWFDGRTAQEYDNPDLQRLVDHVEKATCLILSVPAYWGGPSGVFKNMIDLIGGPLYELDDAHKPFHNKLIGLIVIGASEGDAQATLTTLKSTLESMGAWCEFDHVVIDNPRTAPNQEKLLQEAYTLGRTVAAVWTEVKNNGVEIGS